MKKGEVEDVINEAKLHAILDDLYGVQPIDNATSKLKMKIDEFRFAWTNVHKTREFAPHVKQPAFIRFTSGTTGKSSMAA